MTRQPKTNELFTVDEFNEACRLILQVRRGYSRWRRLRRMRKGLCMRRCKKGRRAKSGQWWRREPQLSTRSWAQAIDADLDRCMTIIDEHHDSRRVMEALEKWPAGRTSAATDTTIMEALDSHRRNNA